MKARDIIEAEDPKKFLKANPQHGLATQPMQVNYESDYGWHFYFGGPVAVCFDVVAPTRDRAIALANAHWDRLRREHLLERELRDQFDTQVVMAESLMIERLGWEHVLMYWRMADDAVDEDPTMNDEWTGR